MWKVPPIIKVYEALGAVVDDDRLEIAGNTAKCYSSSGNKFYDVTYSPEQNAIMVNDNGSYWKGYLGYPAIAYLLKIGVLEFRPELAGHFKGILWKDINQTYKNDFDKTVEYIFRDIDSARREEIEDYAKKLLKDIEALNLSKFGTRQKPPLGY
jgi:hypothetical protein